LSSLKASHEPGDQRTRENLPDVPVSQQVPAAQQESVERSRLRRLCHVLVARFEHLFEFLREGDQHQALVLVGHRFDAFAVGPEREPRLQEHLEHVASRLALARSYVRRQLHALVEVLPRLLLRVETYLFRWQHAQQRRRHRLVALVAVVQQRLQLVHLVLHEQPATNNIHVATESRAKS
jgi:hypothetical protein